MRERLHGLSKCAGRETALPAWRNEGASISGLHTGRMGQFVQADWMEDKWLLTI